MKPEDYVWIARWGHRLGSYDYYIKGEQERAARQNAPAGALYQASSGEWVTINDVTNEGTRYYFKMHYPDDCPKEWDNDGR